MSRKKIIAGNWKMNKTPSETAVFIKELSDKVNQTNDIIIMCSSLCMHTCCIKSTKEEN
jgi:triosephosphate isomerase